MPIDPDFLKILACPKCKGGIQQDSKNEALICPHCAVRYPVRNGIPVMLSDEAEKI